MLKFPISNTPNNIVVKGRTSDLDERKEAEARSERIQKAHNDRMMLVVTTISVIVALAAVGVTLWASLDTSENSKKALELQTKSIDAQIQAMHNDERPHLTVEAEGTEQLWFSDSQARTSTDNAVRFQVTVPSLHVLAFGRTPAVSIENHEDCTLFTDDGGRLFPNPSSDWIAMDTVIPGHKQNFSCLPQGRMPVGTTLGKFNYVELKGFIKYHSLAGDEYTTPYCFEYYVHPGDPRRLVRSNPRPSSSYRKDLT